MGTVRALVNRERPTLVWIGYWTVWVGLSTLYRRMADSEVPGQASELTDWWWFLAFLYFLVDVVIVLTAKFFDWTLTPASARKPFVFEAARIVPVWLLLHLMTLFQQYPVSSRLKAVGLGPLEFLVFTAVMTLGAAEFFKYRSTRPQSDVD